jgi:hypothetical protein
VGGIDWSYIHPFATEIIGESSTGRKATPAELCLRNKLIEDPIPDLLVPQERLD